MTRWMVVCVCLVLVASGIARGADPLTNPPAGAPGLDTPEKAMAFLSSIRQPLSVEDAIRTEALLRTAMREAPNDMRWPAGIAILSRYKDGIPDADELAHRATQMAPDSADSWFALGIVLVSRGQELTGKQRAERTMEAIRTLDQALAVDPSHEGALEMAIEFYSSAPASVGGNRNRAIALCDQMMAMEPIRWRGAELRARTCMIARDWAGVDEWFAKGIAWATDPAIARELHRQHAMLYVNFAKDYPRAIALATPFADPGAPDADRFSFVIGQAAYRMDDCALAVEHDKRVVAAGDPPPNVLMELADCQERSGDLAGAAATLELFAVRFKGHAKEEQVLISLNRLRAALQSRGEAPPASAPPPAPASTDTPPGGV